MRYSEPVELKRDTPAILIPAGTPTILPKGTEVTITQSLGGTYTVIGQGMMARIAGNDADALGIDTSADQKKEEYKGGPADEQEIWEQMKNCYDPEIPVNIVDLGLIYDCKVTPLEGGTGNKVDIKMTLTAPGCGLGPAIASDVEQRVRSVPGVSDVNVEVVWDPIWNQSMMSDAARLQLGLM
jgi:probable FeS assembly SUF system protein SufT